METPDPSKLRNRRWRWRQYSLSTLLVAVTIVGVWLGVVTNRAERQRRAVASIRELGGTVRYDFEPDNPRGMAGMAMGGSPPGNPPAQELPGPDWLCRILGVDYFADVVYVQAFDMTDSTCSHLSALAGLQKLDLIGSPITDAGLEELARLRSLNWLHLRATRVTDAGIEKLRRLTSLRFLHLGDTQVTDAGLAHLAELTSLRSLHLADTRVSDAGLAHLAGLTSLRTLDVERTQVTGEGCRRFRKGFPKCYVYHKVLQSPQ